MKYTYTCMGESVNVVNADIINISIYLGLYCELTLRGV